MPKRRQNPGERRPRVAGEKPLLLAGGNPQIAKAEGDGDPLV